MRSINTFLYEWTHFIRSPFKIVAILLFGVAGIYGLNNGAHLFHKQLEEIKHIEQHAVEERQIIIEEQYKKGKLISEDRPWIDYSSPFWAIYSSQPYHFKTPSPAMVYSIGQSEQYGYYKRITVWDSPYDSDLAKEIANPERLQTGTLDFSFNILFLMPLVLMILLYNIKSVETEQGLMSLIEVQNPSKNMWILSRVSFYILLMLLVIVCLLFYGGMLTNIFKDSSEAFGQMFFYTLIYLLLWSTLYYFILTRSKSVLANTLLMSGIYLLFAFIVPAIVHQLLSIKNPANMMVELIDVRDQQEELYELSDSVLQSKLNILFPEIARSPVYHDSSKVNLVRNRSMVALDNELKKNSIQPIEREFQEKNAFIRSTFLYNPVSFFQNRFNSIAQTHFKDYQEYRNEIQMLIDKQIDVLIQDMWHERIVDEKRYIEYSKLLTKAK